MVVFFGKINKRRVIYRWWVFGGDTIMGLSVWTPTTLLIPNGTHSVSAWVGGVQCAVIVMPLSWSVGKSVDWSIGRSCNPTLVGTDVSYI